MRAGPHPDVTPARLGLVIEIDASQQGEGVGLGLACDAIAVDVATAGLVVRTMDACRDLDVVESVIDREGGHQLGCQRQHPGFPQHSVGDRQGRRILEVVMEAHLALGRRLGRDERISFRGKLRQQWLDNEVTHDHVAVAAEGTELLSAEHRRRRMT
jgi:hypothetical protein